MLETKDYEVGDVVGRGDSVWMILEVIEPYQYVVQCIGEGSEGWAEFGETDTIMKGRCYEIASDYH